MIDNIKQILDYGFKRVIWYKNQIIPIFRRYPKYLNGSWIQWTMLNDRHGSRAIECVYVNSDHPEGTAVFSNFINNDYPASWATIIMGQYDENNKYHTAFGDRFYTSINHRRKRINSSLAILGYSIFLLYYNIMVKQGGAHTQAGFDLQMKMTRLMTFMKRVDISKEEELSYIMGGVKPQVLIQSDNDAYKDPIRPAGWHSMSIWDKDDKRN